MPASGPSAGPRPSAREWLHAARPRTLVAPGSSVVVAAALVVAERGRLGWGTPLCLVVALSLTVAVNYANDYSDGIRGVDAERVGPARLVGGGADPRLALGAAAAAAAVASAAGLVLALAAGWWLVPLGALCLVGAWFYTGGSHPYGYRGLGELGVFCFYGLVAVIGTYVVAQTDPPGSLGVSALVLAVGAGAFAVTLLTANNLRDLAADRSHGKRTLPVLMGDRGGRRLYVATSLVPGVVTLTLAAAHPAAVLGLAYLPAMAAPWRTLRESSRSGGAVAPVLLATTARAQAAWAGALAVGLVLGRALGW